MTKKNKNDNVAQNEDVAQDDDVISHVQTQTAKTNAQRLRETRARQRAKRPESTLSDIKGKELAKLTILQRLEATIEKLVAKIPNIVIDIGVTLANGWKNQRKSLIYYTCAIHGKNPQSVDGFYTKTAKYIWDFLQHPCPECSKEARDQNNQNHAVYMKQRAIEARESKGLEPLTAEQLIISKAANNRRKMSRVAAKQQKGFCLISGQKLRGIMGPHGRPYRGTAANCGDAHHLLSQSMYPSLAKHPSNVIYLHRAIHRAYHDYDKEATIDGMINFVHVILDKNHAEHSKVINSVYDYGFFDVFGNPLTFLYSKEEVLLALAKIKAELEAAF